MLQRNAAARGKIRFNGSASPATIVLTGTLLPVVTGAVDIDGGGLVTIRGNNSSRHFQVHSLGSLMFRRLTISIGLTSGDGGTIRSSGALSKEACTVANTLRTTSSAGERICLFQLEQRVQQQRPVCCAHEPERRRLRELHLANRSADEGRHAHCAPVRRGATWQMP